MSNMSPQMDKLELPPLDLSLGNQAVSAGGSEEAAPGAFPKLELPPLDLNISMTDSQPVDLTQQAEIPSPTGQELPKEEGNVWDATKAGVQEALVPFSMEAEDRKKAIGNSKTALASYIVSNLATGIATGAAIGSAVPVLGNAVGAGAGAIAAAAKIAPALFAVYSGLGRDRLRSQEEGEEWNPLSGKGIATAALTIGTELNPLVKASSKTAALARAAAQVGGEMSIEKLHGGDEKAVGMAGVFGLLGATAVARNVAKHGDGRYAQAVTEDVYKNLTDIDNALKDNSFGWYGKALDKLKNEDLNLPPEPSSEFRRWLVGDIEANLSSKQLEEAYQQASQKLKPEKLQEMYVLHRTEGALSKTVAEETAELNKDLVTAPKIADINKAEEWLNPMLFVARKLDNVTGLETGQMVDKFVQAGHAFNNVSAVFAKEQSKLRKEGLKLGLSGRDVYDLTTGVANDSVRKARAKWGDAVISSYKQDITKHTDKLLGYLGDMGYSPTRRQNYLPMKTKGPTELALEIDEYGKDIQKYLTETNNSFAQLRAATDKYKDGLQHWAIDKSKGIETPRPTPPSEGVELLETMDKLAERRIGRSIEKGSDLAELKERILSKTAGKDVEEVDSDMSALFARTGEIPERLQQKNAWELLQSYTNENIRAAHFESALKTGQMYVRALEAAGLKKAAQLYGTYVKDQMGNSWGLNGVIRNFMSKMEYEGTKLARDTTKSFVSRKAGETVAALPEFASWLNNQIYPSKLGLNVGGMLRNTTQFLTNSAPEIGPVYGQKLALRGAMATAKEMKEGMLKAKLEGKGLLEIAFSSQLKENLKGRNLASDFFIGEHSEAFRSFGKVKESVQYVNDRWIMPMYQATDTMNRAISYNMGREIAKDLLSGSRDAVKFLQGTDATLRASIRRAMKDGAGSSVEENVGDAIGRYLISKTQFNYGKAAQAQWARAVGPMFSMFSTWPNMVGADIINVLREKKAGESAKLLSTKYLAPYALAVGISKMMEDSDSPTYKYLVGQPESWVPFDAVAPKAGDKGRGVLSNPLADYTKETLGAATSIMEGDVRRPVKKALQTGATTYLPIVGPILNEADKISKIWKGEKLTDRIARKLGMED